eukprot:CAMPEP_0182448876 /NCGR_PEP_ID=MMETSP1172-20130603/30410_1 /TAXON_ID=708627 /ORGANISM="Timspurckia oligopyrenoides, Strain CCMP3278" /LENGTH=117 /DNA_ID=CAMNT_0024645915 /DNA_START=333 /DNA_END=686 /DNA_ORIENTATION=-
MKNMIRCVSQDEHGLIPRESSIREIRRAKSLHQLKHKGHVMILSDICDVKMSKTPCYSPRPLSNSSSFKRNVMEEEYGTSPSTSVSELSQRYCYVGFKPEMRKRNQDLPRLEESKVE